MQQLQKAVALHNRGELDQAEAIYTEVLAVDENNFYALRFLGCICRAKGLYQDGIIFLKRAVIICPDNADCWFNLGNILMDACLHEDAIDSFRKSLQFKPDFAESLINLSLCLFELHRFEESRDALERGLSMNSSYVQGWLNLGNTYLALDMNDKAIESYQQATLLNPNFADAYIGLSYVLRDNGEIDDAISSCRKAIELKPDLADLYLNLGLMLNEKGRFEEASDSFVEYYRRKPIAKSISCTTAEDFHFHRTADEIKVPDGAEFIPAFVSDEIPFGMHLMYVHIPKVGGIRFSNPIFGCIQKMFLSDGWDKYSDLAASAFGRRDVALMASHRLDSDPMRDGMIGAFSSYDIPDLDFSFLTPHGVSYRELLLAMDESFGIEPVRLATWRNPLKRLRSALDYLWRTSKGDLDLIREQIRSRDPFLDNAIYRGCFSDFCQPMMPYQQSNLSVDYLIDIGDFTVMNLVASSFLSRCRLPNIIVNKRLNLTSNDMKMDVSVAGSLLEECIESGFISRDSSPFVNQLVSQALPLEFELGVNSSSASVHPLTFVVSAVTNVNVTGGAWLFPTEYLMTDEGQIFLQEHF